MNIFQKISLINKVSKAIKEFNKLKENNEETINKVKEIIEELIASLNKLKNLMPEIKDLVELIKDFLKKF